MKRIIILFLLTVIGSSVFMTKPALAQTLDPGAIYVNVKDQQGVPVFLLMYFF